VSLFLHCHLRGYDKDGDGKFQDNGEPSVIWFNDFMKCKICDRFTMGDRIRFLILKGNLFHKP
jgi:hypothetical protein